MPKMPDEIKQGLVEAVAEMFWATKDGDADDMRRVCGIAHASMADALILIQQLVADNAQLNRCIENMTDKLNAMNDEAAKLQAERDAAVADLRRAMHCPSCANWRKPEKAAVCFACQYGRTRRFEWRGVQKEEEP